MRLIGEKTEVYSDIVEEDQTRLERLEISSSMFSGEEMLGMGKISTAQNIFEFYSISGIREFRRRDARGIKVKV